MNIKLILYAVALAILSVAFYVTIQYSNIYKKQETYLVLLGMLIFTVSVIVLVKSLESGSIAILLPIAFTIKLVLVVAASRLLFSHKVNIQQICALVVMIAGVIWYTFAASKLVK